MTEKIRILNIIGTGASGSTALGLFLAKKLDAYYLGELTKKYRICDNEETKFLKFLEICERNYLFLALPNLFVRDLKNFTFKELQANQTQVIVLTSKSFYLTRYLNSSDDFEVVNILVKRGIKGYVQSRFKSHSLTKNPFYFIIGRLLAVFQFYSLSLGAKMSKPSLILHSTDLSKFGALFEWHGTGFDDNRIAGGTVTGATLRDLQ